MPAVTLNINNNTEMSLTSKYISEVSNSIGITEVKETVSQYENIGIQLE